MLNIAMDKLVCTLYDYEREKCSHFSQFLSWIKHKSMRIIMNLSISSQAVSLYIGYDQICLAAPLGGLISKRPWYAFGERDIIEISSPPLQAQFRPTKLDNVLESGGRRDKMKDAIDFRSQFLKRFRSGLTRLS